jgi:hypothetical protein
VGVEKLFPAKIAKIKSRQDALQTTFSVFLDIFYPPNLAILRKMDFFNTHGCKQQHRCSKSLAHIVVDTRVAVNVPDDWRNQAFTRNIKGAHFAVSCDC